MAEQKRHWLVKGDEFRLIYRMGKSVFLRSGKVGTSGAQPKAQDLDLDELLAMHEQDGWTEVDGKEMKLAAMHGSKKPHPLEKSAKVQSAKLALGERFGLVGKSVGDALPLFTFDLIVLISGYCVAGVAVADAQPTKLLTFNEIQDTHLSPVRTVACHRGEIWVASAGGINVCNQYGKLLKKLPASTYSSIVFDMEYGVVYFARYGGAQQVTKRTLADDASMGPSLFLNFNASALALDPKGNIYACNSGFGAVRVFSRDGKEIRHFDVYKPSALAVTGYDHCFVLSTDNENIQEFDSKGKLVRRFGSSGVVTVSHSAPGKLNAPLGFTLDRAGQVLVADTKNNRVQVFTGTGVFVTAFGDGLFKLPTCVCVDGDGRVIVGDEYRASVFAF